MYHLGEPTKRRSETRRYREVLFACQGFVALLLAALFIPAPGMIATAAIAATAITLMGVQHLVARQLGTKSAELIGRQEALLAEAKASRNRTEELFAMTGILQSAEDHADAGAVLMATSLYEARAAGRNGVRAADARAPRGGGGGGESTGPRLVA